MAVALVGKNLWLAKPFVASSPVLWSSVGAAGIGPVCACAFLQHDWVQPPRGDITAAYP